MEVIGVIVTILFALGATGVGLLLFRRWLTGLDPALQLGTAALLGLGLAGVLTLPIGLIQGGPSWGIGVVGAYALVGYFGLWKAKGDLGLRLPQGPTVAFPVVLAVAAFMSLVGVLAPSDVNDWDSLAYHLAVPKLWIQQGHISSIPYIHHSNFPAAVDNLYIWGLQWGERSGAVAFQWCFYLAGIVALFGMARSRYGEKAAWWAALVFAFIPVAIWESGTAYIDVAHGLFAGLGILFAALLLESGEKRYLWLSAVLLGLSAASKYTGLQTIVCVALVLFVASLIRKESGAAFQRGLVVGLVGVAIASPWLLLNTANVGNPVYPYMFERFGGANWDQRRADIYKNEQQTFGVGRTESGRDPSAMGHAILGLAYQPGRFVNPGQETGNGSPLGGLGMAVLAAMMLWLFSGKSKAFEGVCLATVLLSAAMWFFLSQQSRYILTWAVPLSVLAGGAVVRLAIGQLMAGLIAIQGLVTAYLMYDMRLSMQLPVVMGQVDAAEYQKTVVPFGEAAAFMNRELGKNEPAKVALYDEVFGYLLDVPYFWANPGHSTIIPYDSMKSSEDFVKDLRKLGFTHIYISLSPITKDPAFAKRWLGSMGFSSGGQSIPDDERTAKLGNWQSKWEILLADAVKEGRVAPVQLFRNGILFSIPPELPK